MLKTPWTTSPGSFYTLRGQKLFRGNSILALVSANSFFWSLSTDHDHRWRVCRSTGRLFMVSYHLTPTDKHRVPSLLIPHQFICLSTFASLGKLPRYLNPPHLGLQLIPSGRSTLLWHRASVSDLVLMHCEASSAVDLDLVTLSNSSAIYKKAAKMLWIICYTHYFVLIYVALIYQHRHNL